MKVTMIGAGYVGLVSGACFAEFGADVMCVDKDPDRVSSLQAGRIPIYEPGLERLVAHGIASRRLQFTTCLDSVRDSDLVFIAVGTPSRHGDGHADLSYVHAAATEIAPYLSGYTLIVNKSTVPVGTARQVKQTIATANPGADFDVASNPEFLREGAAVSDFMRPDRVVIGTETARAEKLLRELYRPLNLIETPILATDLESAELIKYAANAFLATKISFINEMAVICEKTGADVHAVAKGMGMDNRIGRKFLHPGPGFGGSCFPKDTRALVRIALDLGVPSLITQAVIEVNEKQKQRMVDKIRAALGGTLKGRNIAVLGLSFKPETDDMREAPALYILPRLIEAGAVIRAHDPQALREARMLLPGVQFIEDLYQVFDGADAAVLMTEWNVYRGLDIEAAARRMSGKVFVDLRNVYDPVTMRAAGFSYHAVGRP